MTLLIAVTLVTGIRPATLHATATSVTLWIKSAHLPASAGWRCATAAAAFASYVVTSRPPHLPCGTRIGVCQLALEHVFLLTLSIAVRGEL